MYPIPVPCALCLVPCKIMPAAKKTLPAIKQASLNLPLCSCSFSCAPQLWHAQHSCACSFFIILYYSFIKIIVQLFNRFIKCRMLERCALYLYIKKYHNFALFKNVLEALFQYILNVRIGKLVIYYFAYFFVFYKVGNS